jgi:hypothetical protein
MEGEYSSSGRFALYLELLDAHVRRVLSVMSMSRMRLAHNGCVRLTLGLVNDINCYTRAEVSHSLQTRVGQ